MVISDFFQELLRTFFQEITKFLNFSYSKSFERTKLWLFPIFFTRYFSIFVREIKKFENFEYELQEPLSGQQRPKVLIKVEGTF
jgi:hypothetical protein